MITTSLRVLLLIVLSGNAICLIGCGSTCDRINEDRRRFLARKVKNTEPQIEAIVPFALANELIAAQIGKIKPVPIKIPGLGQLESYFGQLTVVPKQVTMRPAASDYLGFRLDLDITTHGKKAFSMYADLETKPAIDLEKGSIAISFGPKNLENVKPKLSGDAQKALGGIIYSQIPKMARFLIPRSAVDSAAGSVVKMLLDTFYDKFKDELLPKLSQFSQIEFQLTTIPLQKLNFSSSAEAGGGVRIVAVTGLPVQRGLSILPDKSRGLPQNKISLRISGSTAAELVNWGMATGRIPDRYDSKGKPKADGNLRPGLDWVSGERPMKIYLWDLEKPCMRVNMSATPVIEANAGKLAINAKDAVTDDIEASAFTKAGVWFYLLWRDAIELKKRAPMEMKFSIAGKEMIAVVDQASIENNEFISQVSLNAAKN